VNEGELRTVESSRGRKRGLNTACEKERKEAQIFIDRKPVLKIPGENYDTCLKYGSSLAFKARSSYRITFFLKLPDWPPIIKRAEKKIIKINYVSPKSLCRS